MRPLAIIGIVYLVASVIAFVANGLDKRAASRGRRRIPESWLHGLELAGGWPGALVGQRMFRHKTSKLSYRFVFWLIVALHAIAWATWGWFALRGCHG